MIRLINLYDSPSFQQLDSFNLENVTDFDVDESFGLGNALRSALVLRKVISISNIQNAKTRGGVGRRQRFYEAESRKCDELG